MHHLAAVFCCLAAALPGQQRAIAGAVRDAAGSAAPSAVVQLRWRAHPELPGLVGHSLGDGGLEQMQVAVDAEGRFQLRPPNAGPFELVARSASGDGCSAPVFPVMAGAFVELQLAAPVFVGGIVRDAEGVPLASIEVTLRPQLTSWTRLSGYRQCEARGSAITDGDGRFRLPLPDSYLQGPRWEAFVVPEFAAAGLWTRQEVLLRPTRSCAELDLQLVAAASERGTVLGPDGAPLAGATVLESTAPQRAVSTLADGSFALPARFRRDVVVLAPGCAVAMLPPAANLGPAHPLAKAAAVVQLQKAARLRAHLVDGRGRPLAGAPVLWSIPLAAGPPLEFAAMTDANGGVAFDRAGGGFATLGFVAIDGGYQPFARVEAVADLDLGVVHLGAPRQLRGQVLGSDGTPLADVRVAALPQAPLRDETAWITYTDHGGRFAFSGLPRGRLEVFADASVLGLAAAAVAAGATDTVLRLPAGGVVEGEVRDADGAPMVRAFVTLVRTGGVAEGVIPGPNPGMTCVCGHSDADGHFRFVGLPAGDWQVLGNSVRDGVFHGGGAKAVTDGAAVALQLRQGPG